MKVIGILGCGWLGIPLGLDLQKKKWQVKASRRSDEGIELLKKNRLRLFQHTGFINKNI